jgi:DNA-binding XRE family transcriptional regulator
MTGDDAPKPFELEMRLRNAHLKRRRIALGLSCRQAADAIGIGYQTYLALENLKAAHGRPMTAEGEWSRPAQAVATYFGCTPDELFPPEILAVQQPVVVAEISAQMVRALATPPEGEIMGMLTEGAPDEAAETAERKRHVQWAMAFLTPEQRGVLEARMAGDEDGEIAARLGVSRQRVGQLGMDALRVIRERIPQEGFLKPTKLALILTRRLGITWLDPDQAWWLFDQSLGDLDDSMRRRVLEQGYLWPELREGFKARCSHHVSLMTASRVIRRLHGIPHHPDLGDPQREVLRRRFVDEQGCAAIAADTRRPVADVRRLEISGATTLRPDWAHFPDE